MKTKEKVNLRDIFNHRIELIKVFGMICKGKDDFATEKFLEQVKKLEKFVELLIETQEREKRWTF